MRLSTQQLFSGGLNNMLDVNAQLQKTQLQISSGKKILTPSDDPVAATRVLQLNQQLSLTAQFKSNIDAGQNLLGLQDQTLGSVDDVLQRVRELATQAGDGALSADDRKSIADEVRQRLDQLAGLLNTKDPSGEYLFGGFQGKTQPFVQNESGTYVYQGDEGQRYVQIDNTVSVPATENGKTLFVDVPAVNNTFYTSANPKNLAQPPATISTGEITDQAAFDQLYPDNLVVQFNPYTNVVPNGPNFTITVASSGKPLLSNQPYVAGQPIAVAGMQFDINGQPQVGDTFFVNSTPKQGMLTTMEKLIYGLEHFDPSEAGQKVFSGVVSDALGNIQNAETALLNGRSRIGARQNTLDNMTQMHTDVNQLSQQVLSGLQDLDYADAVSKLSLQSFVLQAAQQTYSKVSSLSLFDQIR